MLQGQRREPHEIAWHFAHDMLLRRFRQMATDFRQKTWRGYQDQPSTVALTSRHRDALGQLARELFDGVLLVTSAGLQTRSTSACAAAQTTGPHRHASWGIGAEIPVVRPCERILQSFQRARCRAGLTQFEYGRVPRIRDEYRITVHRGGLTVEAI